MLAAKTGVIHSQPSSDSAVTPILDPKSLAAKLSGTNLIGGKLVHARGGACFPVVNPATGDQIGEAAASSAEDVADAVDAAVEAQARWAKVPARERGKFLLECSHALSAHVEELGRLVALETGKALRTESRPEASVVADMFTFYGGLASELKGESLPLRPDVLALTVREPVGVVGAIIPWNAPMMLMAIKVAPALAAGNAVVVKSAEEAPFAVLRVCQILNQILPSGLFNILSGFGPTCGAPLVANERVSKLTFTGSVETGRIVYKIAAERLLPVTLELGGKSPMIVMGDASLEKAVAGAIAGMRFTRQGQSCTAASRIFVHESIHDAFVVALKDKVDAMKMGDPLDEDTDIGTLISSEQREKVMRYIRLGESTPGAKAWVCSKLPQSPKLAKGLYVRPVIFTGLPNDHQLCQEEIFGPVTCVIKFREYEDAIRQANDTKFGLAATIWTSDLKTALDATQRLQAGFVQVNQNVVVQANMSYGGIKNSGLGKEASLESMLEHFTHKKTIMINMG